MIGAAAVPSELASRLPRKVLPRWNRTESPGWNAVASTLATVCHGAAWLVPGLLSLPVGLT